MPAPPKAGNQQAKMQDIRADETWLLPFLPDELLGEIGAYIEKPKDFVNFSFASHRFRRATIHVQGQRIDNITVYPRLACMKALLGAVQDEMAGKYVRNITLLAEGLKEHEFGYDWAWEDLQIWGGLEFCNEDVKIINMINAAHSDDVMANGDFIISGEYRTMLTAVLQRLPNLRTITCRKLAAGEQIPGWSGVKLFEKLSFYCDGLDTRHIFYGDWMYDTLHRRITHYRDEFGDLISEPDCGPQASFVDDLKASMNKSGTKAKVVFMPVAKYESA
ncbi:uncharacterized protein M421DRAFT_422289 [Didymella exigua CBS 183.55]|uniref:Uncharacterized protein n=1 Tax=Didymella exigua CBS 183.55 TaxID=1150837 RepID=A0A6A5RFI9_9PLEO|nr:uncharacterized protein M421DRAFT_422289 [Didymella exigua CBS 183.55]KAF1927055.1 hypothetical protein M421DRAFT_422289 [Didymella exigua CBS 183.55]